MPGTRCTVAVCNNSHAKTKHQNPPISYHKFPKNEKIRKEWIQRCRREGKWNPETCHVCSIHFTKDDFEPDIKSIVMGLNPKNNLKNDAVPSQHLGLRLLQEPEVSARSQRIEAKEKKKFIEQITKKHKVSEELMTDDRNNQDHLEVSTQPVESATEVESKIRHQKECLDQLIEENKNLKQELLLYKINSRSEMRKLKQQIKYLKSKKYSEKTIASLIKKTLSHVLTNNQIDKLLSNKKRVNWTADEISTAFTLRYFSKRCYIYLRQKLHYPLPGLSTLQTHAAKLNMRQGILDGVLRFMNIAGQDMTTGEKLTVLQFDEVKVKAKYEYDKASDEVVGPHSQLQTVQARGLIGKWKQPVYLGFDQKMTKDLITDIINKLHGIGYEVVACVSDCGGGNVGLWRDLDISMEQSYFLHPVTENAIYFFADAPHLLKLIRNWLLDNGFLLEDGTIITNQPLVELIKLTNHEVSVCHKLTKLHITCKGAQRQNVSLASQLLSHSTAVALKHYKPGHDKNLAVNTGDFVELVNSWFDIMNSYKPVEQFFPSKSGYGVSLDIQNDILDRMFETIKNMKCIGKNTLQIFQKGLLMSINSLKGLQQDMKNRYNLSYLLTHKLNQDSLENFFSQLRTRGGLDDHPTPMNALFRIRMVILGKNPGIVHKHSNTVDMAPDEYIVAKVLRQASVQVPVSEPEINPATEVHEDTDGFSTSSTSSHNTSSTSSPQNARKQKICQGETANDAINYLAGWVARKHKDTDPELGDYTYVHGIEHGYALPSWIQHLSYGGLTEPSAEWAASAMKFDKYFKKHHGDSNSAESVSLQKGKGVVANLVKRIMKRTTLIPEHVVESFIRQRTFIRMNYLNYKLELKKSLKRKFIDKNRENDRQRQIHNKQRRIIE